MEKTKTTEPKFSVVIFPLMKYIKKRYNFQSGASGLRKINEESSGNRRGRSSGADNMSEFSRDDSSGNRGTSLDQANLSFNDQLSIGSVFDNVSNMENNLQVISQGIETKKDLFSFEEQENEEDSEPEGGKGGAT